MAFNYLGVPIGAALAGILADSSIETAIVLLGIGGATASFVAAALLVPREEAAPSSAESRAVSQPPAGG